MTISLFYFTLACLLTTANEQLQPQNECHELKLQKNFAISLFERLIGNGAPCITLTHQRRMHPELTHLHSWIYGNIVDGVSSEERGIPFIQLHSLLI